MKKTILFTTVAFIFISGIILNGCALQPVDDNDRDPEVNDGTIVIYTKEDVGGKINVYLDDIYRGQITKYYPSAYILPCDGSYELTLTLEPKSYKLHAYIENGLSWDGNFIVDPYGCRTIELTSGSNTNQGSDPNYTPIDPDPKTNPTSPCGYSFEGRWRRTGGGTSTYAHEYVGMIIDYKNGIGTIEYIMPNNHNGVVAGQVYWKEFIRSNCTMNVLKTDAVSFKRTSAEFTDINHLVIAGEHYYEML